MSELISRAKTRCWSRVVKFMTNWRTNLGGAISVTGTSLIGVGILAVIPATTPAERILWWVALAGFVCSAIGKGVTALFAADAKAVQNQIATVYSKTTANSANIETVAAATNQTENLIKPA